MQYWKSKLRASGKWPLIGLSVFIFSFSFNIAVAEGAMLYLSPSSGNHTVGNIVNVSVLVNTQGQAINNVDATIRFPSSVLEVVSISKSGSIFTLWVEEPAFSNSAGTISLNGGLPTPGYNGTAGRVVTIAFRIKTAGSASIVITSGAVRANDGFGTDVLSSLGSATYTISPAPVVPPPEPTPIPSPPAPTVETVEETPEPAAEVPPVLLEPVTPQAVWYEKIMSYIYYSDMSGSLLGLILLIIAILVVLLIYGRSRFVRLRSNVRYDTYDVEKVLHRSFDTIKEDIVACVGLLERARNRRHLTEEERAVVSLLKQHLRDTEKFVTKELHDIRRRIED